MLFFPFDETYGSTAAEQKDSREDKHPCLGVADHSENDTSESRCDNLRKTDGAVEKAEVASKVLTRKRIGQKGERQGEHRRPGCTYKEIGPEKEVLVMNEYDGNESYGADDEAEHIGKLERMEPTACTAKSTPTQLPAA